MAHRVLAGVVVAGMLVLAASSACHLTPVHPGKALLSRKCSSCHTTPTREKIRSVGLPKILEKHKSRAHLNNDEIEQIRAYVESTSRLESAH